LPWGVATIVPTADTTAQAVPFAQDWSNSDLITTSDDWGGVHGIAGYRGDGLVSTTGIDPQTVLGEGTLVVDVNATTTCACAPDERAATAGSTPSPRPASTRPATRGPRRLR
jgi:hypothetical protein